jgi:hypothetical protein
MFAYFPNVNLNGTFVARRRKSVPAVASAQLPHLGDLPAWKAAELPGNPLGLSGMRC